MNFNINTEIEGTCYKCGAIGETNFIARVRGKALFVFAPICVSCHCNFFQQKEWKNIEEVVFKINLDIIRTLGYNPCIMYCLLGTL